MNIFYDLSKHPVRLFIVTQILMLLTFVFRDFPIFAFLAFAPMFALIDHPSALKDFSLPFLVAMLTAFILYSFKQKQSSIAEQRPFLDNLLRITCHCFYRLHFYPTLDFEQAE